MKCPFRARVDYDYEKAEKGYLEKSQVASFEECYEEECPYYDQFETPWCRRASDVSYCE